MPATRTTLFLPSGTLPHLAPREVNLVPFHVGYTGPAQVDVYFTPRPAVPSGLGHPSSTAAADVPGPDVKEGSTGRSAAFRGRQVHEHVLPLPAGYTGVVFSAPPPPSGRTEDVPAVLDVAQEEEEGAAARRSTRKRKFDRAVQTAAPAGEKAQKVATRGRVTRARGKHVSRFSLDDDDDEDHEDHEEGENGLPVPDAVVDHNDEPNEEGGEETQIEEQVVPLLPLSQHQHHPQKKEHTDSLLIVDETLALPVRSAVESVSTPTPAAAAAAREGSPTPTRSPTPLETNDDMTNSDTADRTPPPPQTVHIRRIHPQATFHAISLWSADEPMYTSSSAGPVDGETGKAAVGEANAGNTGERMGEEDVQRVMAERDEYARVVNEWRRVAEVVHSW